MNRHTQIATRRVSLAAFGLLVLLIAGCGRVPGPSADPTADSAVHSARLQQTSALSDDLDDAEDYDPFQPFNERMFWFNHSVLDRYLIRPAATGWSKIAPTSVRQSVARFFNNLEMPKRLVNNLLQARPIGAGRELARFTVNTTVGVAGLFDVASALDIHPSEADAGQTLAMYGVGAGPYLVLPTFPPLTVRDAIGRGIDGVMDPVGYFLPFFANRAKSIVTAVNERSLNLTLYANVEESVLDLYTAARNGYLQRRRTVVRKAVASRSREWEWAFAPQPTFTARPVATSTQEPPA